MNNPQAFKNLNFFECERFAYSIVQKFPVIKRIYLYRGISPEKKYCIVTEPYNIQMIKDRLGSLNDYDLLNFLRLFKRAFHKVNKDPKAFSIKNSVKNAESLLDDNYKKYLKEWPWFTPDEKVLKQLYQKSCVPDHPSAEWITYQLDFISDLFGARILKGNPWLLFENGSEIPIGPPLEISEELSDLLKDLKLPRLNYHKFIETMIKTGEEIDMIYDSIANIGFSGRKALMPEDYKKTAKEEFENNRHLFKFVKAEHLDQITLYHSLNTGQAPRNFKSNLLKMIFEDEKLGKHSGNKLYKVYQSLHKDSTRRNPQAAD